MQALRASRCLKCLIFVISQTLEFLVIAYYLRHAILIKLIENNFPLTQMEAFLPTE
jgi:hypothetical protein